MEIIVGNHHLLIDMLLTALEDWFAEIFIVGGSTLIAGLLVMIFTDSESREHRFGQGLLFLGLGFSMYPSFKIMIFLAANGHPLELPSWLLIAPAIVGPVICGPMAWLSFRSAMRDDHVDVQQEKSEAV